MYARFPQLIKTQHNTRDKMVVILRYEWKAKCYSRFPEENRVPSLCCFSIIISHRRRWREDDDGYEERPWRNIYPISSPLRRSIYLTNFFSLQTPSSLHLHLNFLNFNFIKSLYPNHVYLNSKSMGSTKLFFISCNFLCQYFLLFHRNFFIHRLMMKSCPTFFLFTLVLISSFAFLPSF